MFVRAIKIATKAMFPIFRFDKINDLQQKIGVVGTGFFINGNGYFISVAHIFDNQAENTHFGYWGHLPEEIINPYLKIEEMARDDNADIYIGKVDLKNSNFVRLAKQTSDIGLSVCVSGYPLAVITNNPQGGLELGGVRRYFQPSFVLDKWKVNCDNGAGKIRTHDGFLVRDFGLFGMSGGPIIDKKGVVVGMQGSITQPRISSNGQRTITVENAIAIRSNLVIDFLTNNKINIPKQ